MAKKKIKNNSKGLNLALAIVVIVVVVIGGVLVWGALTKFTFDTNPYCLFGHEYRDGVCVKCGDAEPSEEPLLAVLDKDGNELTEAKYAMPNALIFAFRRANAVAEIPVNTVLGSVTLEAEVEPLGASEKAVTWHIEFTDAENAWAQGKDINDYLRIVVSEEDMHIATVECLQPFGAQMRIVVTSEDEPEISAYATVDFVKRLQGIEFNVAENAVVDFGTTLNLIYTPVYSDGTITGSLKITDAACKLSDELFNSVKNEVKSGQYNFRQSFDIPQLRNDDCADVEMGENTRFLQAIGNPGNGIAQWQVAFYNFVKNHTTRAHAAFEVTYDYNYQGRAGASGTASVQIMFSLSSCHVDVTDIELTPGGGIVF